MTRKIRLIGIYAITHVDSGRVYIGSSVDIKERWHEHRVDLKGGRHDNRHLQRTWTKYGAAAFTFCIVEECDISAAADLEIGSDAWRAIVVPILLDREQYWMDITPNTFNMTIVVASHLGMKRRPETCAKISASHMGNQYGKGNKSGTGRTLTDEHRAKISAANRGRVQTLATRAKISAAHKGMGHPQTPATRAKISATLQGRNLIAEHREKLLEAQHADT